VPSGLPDESAILDALDQPRIKVLTLSWVSFATGYTFDLARVGRACRDRGIYFVVDAIQGVGARPLDVHACHIDVLACGGQKWLLSPWGTGFEVGTLAYQDLAAFAASVELLLEIGIPCIATHVGHLIEQMIARMHAVGVQIVTPEDPALRAGILTVRPRHAERVNERLARSGILCSLREGAIRLSPHLYSTEDEIERAMDVLVSEM
jgi:selenocysteine lyase/cysteine desulfurase